jgi:hypothetical protein
MYRQEHQACFGPTMAADKSQGKAVQRVLAHLLGCQTPFVGLGPVQLDLPYTTPKVTLTVQNVYNTQAQLSQPG